jgi:putative transposase
LLAVHRSTLYYRSCRDTVDDVELMNQIRDIFEMYPFMGYRKITAMLRRDRLQVNRKRVLRLMRLMGIQAIYQKRNLSKRRQEDAVFPYLLRENPPVMPNDAWCVDITYIRIQGCYAYFVGLIDVVSRRIMGWSLSAFLDTQSCLEALEMALQIAMPKMINSDQGCQFTSRMWVDALQSRGILISMDGKGRYLDNIPIERFWRSLKYEEVYLKSYRDLAEARREMGAYVKLYNEIRPHESLRYQTPLEVYRTNGGVQLVGIV